MWNDYYMRKLGNGTRYSNFIFIRISDFINGDEIRLDKGPFSNISFGQREFLDD